MARILLLTVYQTRSYMKKPRQIKMLTLIAFVGLVGLSACYGNTHTPQPTDTDTPPTPIATPTESVDTGPVHASNFRVDGGDCLADICFERPSPADWLISSGTALRFYALSLGRLDRH